MIIPLQASASPLGVEISPSTAIGLAFLFVLLNGFFVAAEFALVKVRPTQIDIQISEGDRRARLTRHMLAHLDAYLSATQLGITLASLALGWVGEPAFAQAVRAGPGRNLRRSLGGAPHREPVRPRSC
jgi:CBS domain containing-hemolysin-like protein